MKVATMINTYQGAVLTHLDNPRIGASFTPARDVGMKAVFLQHVKPLEDELRTSNEACTVLASFLASICSAKCPKESCGLAHKIRCRQHTHKKEKAPTVEDWLRFARSSTNEHE